MIVEARGNLLEANTDALVNTVNTVGVMGKGIALQFKRAYPRMFKAYAAEAKRDGIKLGHMHVWSNDELTGPRFIINFPTKGHWRSSSKLADIAEGLDDLVAVIVREGITSIAIPPLGCGHGGLQWSQVEPLILDKLSRVPHVEARIYAPDGAPAAAAMMTREMAPRLTPGRAALVAVIDRFARMAGEGASPIAVQKLIYFLQAAGQPLDLPFKPHHYGPYADRLRPMLREMEGHYLSGFGDGSALVEFAEPVTVINNAGATAAATLVNDADFDRRLDRVMQLAEGFESTYSLELLATVHWVATHPSAGVSPSDEAVVAAVRAWSARKGRLFQAAHVSVALEALRRGGWLQRVPSMA